MNICIESCTLNHYRRTGLMTYTEGLLYSLFENDLNNDYTLAYYSMLRAPKQMPGPSGRNFSKVVLRLPDGNFWRRQFILDNVVLPAYMSKNRVRVFHRPSGYTVPALKNVFKILTIHDLRTLTIGDRVWKQDIGHYRKTLQKVDLCVVVSECTKRDLIKFFRVDERKIKVVYLGVDRRFKKLEPKVVESVKSKYKIIDPYLFSVGSVPRKNIIGIIRGFAASHASKKFILVLACGLDMARYKKIACDLGVEHRVRFLASLKDDDLIALYNGCHSFVFPSLYEGFGLPILEAMRCGAPVITSNMSSCPEIAGDAALLVDPLKIKHIASAINLLTGDDLLRKQLIEKGEKRSRLFDWRKFSEHMKQIYALA